jgi:hypothetical protein
VIDAITAPYLPDAMEVLKRSHRQKVSARITVGAAVQEVEISDGTVSFSEDWSPHQQFTITSPALAEAVALSDPRQVATIEVLAGYVYPGIGDDVQVLATGHIRSDQTDQPGDSLVVTCASEEQRSIDTKWLLSRQVKSFAGVREALEYLIDYACPTPGQTVRSTVGAGYRPDLVAAVALEPGRPLWEQIYAIALAAGFWIYVDSSGVWQLQARPAVAGEAAAILREGPGSLVKKIKHSRDLDDYATAAVLRYRWKDAGGADREIFGTWAPPSGTRAAGAGQKTFYAERSTQTDQYGADEAARLTVAALSTRGDSYAVDAIAAYWIRPGQTVSLTEDDVRHIVKTVAFNLGEGTMTITTREPSNLGG